VPPIFNPDAKCEWLITPQSPPLPPWKELLYSLNGRLGGPCAGLDVLQDREVSNPCQDSNVNLFFVYLHCCTNYATSAHLKINKYAYFNVLND